ncbi:calcium-binding protein [Ciceribacter sp. L1K22]|uniref:calcium-binding protein n=1 Tax=Ciceribacter sp. L1K22 TaxID=2820275 RepID=UPI001ABDB4CE|nr:calcium-binding protein [Ciceribacter sp. L1K22]MBO3762532.1 calcium-binding protein [Ciceribacter sp. L1K22]
MGSEATGSAIERVNTSSGGFSQSVTGLADGGWVVAWVVDLEGGGKGISMQRYAADGSRVGGVIELASDMTYAVAPRVTALEDGGWVLNWLGDDTDFESGDIFQRRYDSNGGLVGSPSQVNTFETTISYERSIALLSDGGWVVTWSGFDIDLDGNGIVQRRYAADGTPVGGEIVVNTYHPGSQDTPSVTALEDGGWLVAWTAFDDRADDTDIYMQRYAANGVLVGSETRVNTATVGSQVDAAATGLEDGGWVVVWQGLDSNQHGVYLQRYDANGDPVGGEVAVNTTTSGAQGSPAIVALADGGFVVAWVSQGLGGIFSLVQQRFNAAGSRVGGETVIVDSNVSDKPSIVATEYGWLVMWNASSSAPGGQGPHIRHYALDRVGTTGADTLTGSSWAETLKGLGGNDVLNGLGGADRMEGGTGNDTYYVDNTGDVVVEGANAGADTVRASVSHTLAANVENLVLTGSGNIAATGNTRDNVITGNSGNNTLRGLGGADTLNGGLGADRMEGGTGNDTYYVDNSGDLVVEAANAGTDTVRASRSYTLGSHVENLVLTGTGNLSGTGNSLANVITGNSGANALSGLAGNDTLKGEAGNDRLAGGTGADTLYGGSGADRFVFTALADSTVSSTGRDVIKDFSRSQGDRIDLSAIDASTRTSGNQAFSFIGEKSYSGKAGELRYVNSGGDTFIYADVDGDRKSDFAIRIDANIDLVKGDFIL